MPPSEENSSSLLGVPPRLIFIHAVPASVMVLVTVSAPIFPANPSPDATGYRAWRAHPKPGELAPIAFAVIEGLQGDHRSIEGFWVAPTLRREGVGRLFALDVLARHDGPWTIIFQHDNVGAAHLWRSVANSAFGVNGWSEEERPVPGLADVAPDHFIVSS